jgi:ATPases involved in chromosome partitioning
MVLAVTNLKGGVGKTTLSVMMSLYAVNHLGLDVLLIDMDPQSGTSSLLLGGNIEGITISDALEAAMDGNPPEEMMMTAVRPSIANPHIRVIPSDRRLTNFATNGAPVDLLNYCINSITIPEEMLVIVDTGTSPALVSMGIAAANAVLIPVTMSRQTVRPTANTLSYIIRAHKRLLGLVPVGAGTATWEQDVLTSWTGKLAEIPAIVEEGGVVFPPMPHSKAVVRGNWITSSIPEKFLPTLSQIFKSAGYEVPDTTQEAPAGSTAPEQNVDQD